MAAGVVDVRVIDPTEKQLATVLRKAHAAANRAVETHSPKLERDGEFWTRFARDCLRDREGRRRSCRAGRQTPEVIAGWWSDPAGRRHFRVVGRMRNRYNQLRREGELRGLPAWWQVYPESVLAVRGPKGDAVSYLACCRCGKVGTPESLGWMGDTCGPCFDRRADGGAVAGGFGHFPGWVAWQPRIEFSADGSRLVGAGLGNKLRVVDRLDGSAVNGRTITGAVVAVVALEDGFLFGYADGMVYRWDGAGAPVRVAPKAPGWGRLVLSPDGARVVLLGPGGPHAADLTADKPQYVSVPPDALGQTFTVSRFGPSGSRLFAITPAGELVALDPEKLTATVLRPNLFDGLVRYGFPHDLCVAPDGSAVAVVRETYYPAGHSVRIVPLADSPISDLPLPAWHRPNVAAFAPDGRHLVTADPQAGWVGFWRLPANRCLGFVRAVPEDPGYRGGQLLFSPDGAALSVVYSGLHQDRGSTVVVWPWPEVAAAVGG